MSSNPNPFTAVSGRIATQKDVYSEAEVRLANRNSGILLEMLAQDITPLGMHYLLNHFDVPLLPSNTHQLAFDGAFNKPFTLSLEDIKAMPEVTMPVTLECAGNGRAVELEPRSHSMPWLYEAVGTSLWTGTPLAPLIEQAQPNNEAQEVVFTGADYGYDKGCPHFFARSLTLQQLKELNVLLVYAMNGQPLLPQHGAPLRIVVPGWYGMASVKWLGQITAITEPFKGFQQVQTYQFKASDDDVGIPITELRVKSLMVPPGVPDWSSRKRLVKAGQQTLQGRAWSGAGVPVVKVEVWLGERWQEAILEEPLGEFAWRKWTCPWKAMSGEVELRCRATDANGDVQPMEPRWDVSGFANNVAQKVWVYVE